MNALLRLKTKKSLRFYFKTNGDFETLFLSSDKIFEKIFFLYYSCWATFKTSKFEFWTFYLYLGPIKSHTKVKLFLWLIMIFWKILFPFYYRLYSVISNRRHVPYITKRQNPWSTSISVNRKSLPKVVEFCSIS